MRERNDKTQRTEPARSAGNLHNLIQGAVRQNEAPFRRLERARLVAPTSWLASDIRAAELRTYLRLSAHRLSVGGASVQSNLLAGSLEPDERRRRCHFRHHAPSGLQDARHPVRRIARWLASSRAS